MIELNREVDHTVCLHVTENLDTGAYERAVEWVEAQDYATEDWVEQQGYLTEHQDLSAYATQEWVEDQGYLTEHQDISGKANQSDLTAEINRAEGAEANLQSQIDTLSGVTYYICTTGEYDPQTGMPIISNPQTGVFYLVPSGTAPNLFTEWIYVNNAWEVFGSSAIDLSNYVTTSDLQTALSSKQDALTFDNAPTANSNNPVKSSGIKTAVDAKYTKPTNGIPKTDLESSVQTSLGKADSALQTAPVASVNGKTGTVVLSASDVGAGTYSKPSGGIPKTDLASAVQTSLDKADSALQTAPVTSVNNKTGAVSLNASDVGAYALPSGGIPSTDMSSAVQASLGKADTALQTAPVTSVNNQTGAVVLSIPSSASDVGAIPAPQSPTSGQYLSWNGSAWVATSLPVYSGGVS